MRTLRQPFWRPLALAAAFAATAHACARNPVTGRLEPALISESQEIQIGQQSAVEVEQTLGFVQDEALQRYVQDIGLRMGRDSERPELPWTFRVVDDPVPNAFALPGGYIFLTRGMLSLMGSEAQLASVLGHEIGHVTARHSVAMLSRAQLSQLGLGIGMILVPELQQFGDLASTGLQLLFLRYSRSAEHQADDLGFRYAFDEGYDVREMPAVFQSLMRFGEREQQSPLPQWLSTHPYPEERIERTAARLQALERPLSDTRVARAEYMQRIQGMIYGENPREGFFQQNVFLHPELRFRVTLPSGWQARNTRQAVIATSPQQDAAIQLTLSQAPNPDQALAAFLRQQGIQPGPTSRETVNGIPASVGLFQATTQQGTLQGLAVFLNYGGRVYQVLGFSPAQVYSRYDPVFRQSLGSFGPVSDPNVLNVQPNRISIVQTDRAMTIVEFNQRYPSVIPVEDLALINQVTTTQTIPAGMPVKRVVGN